MLCTVIKVICGVLMLIRCSGESNTCSSYCSQTQNRESLPAASRTALLISSFSVIRSRCRGGALGIDTSKDTIGPVYTWSLHAFSLIGYLSDLLKRFHLHLAT